MPQDATRYATQDAADALSRDFMLRVDADAAAALMMLICRALLRATLLF